MTRRRLPNAQGTSKAQAGGAEITWKDVRTHDGLDDPISRAAAITCHPWQGFQVVEHAGAHQGFVMQHVEVSFPSRSTMRPGSVMSYAPNHVARRRIKIATWQC